MDLRERKTKRAISNAFLELRAHKQLERITIKELSELAEISKATFYLHYNDIYDLSEQMQNDIIEKIFAGIKQPEIIISDPAQFIKELITAFASYQSIIDILFSGTQETILGGLFSRFVLFCRGLRLSFGLPAPALGLFWLFGLFRLLRPGSLGLLLGRALLGGFCSGFFSGGTFGGLLGGHDLVQFSSRNLYHVIGNRRYFLRSFRARPGFFCLFHGWSGGCLAFRFVLFRAIDRGSIFFICHALYLLLV